MKARRTISAVQDAKQISIRTPPNTLSNQPYADSCAFPFLTFCSLMFKFMQGANIAIVVNWKEEVNGYTSQNEK